MGKKPTKPPHHSAFNSADSTPSDLADSRRPSHSSKVRLTPVASATVESPPEAEVPLEAAKFKIEEVITLSKEDSEAFLELLDAPANPTSHLIALMSGHDC